MGDYESDARRVVYKERIGYSAAGLALICISLSAPAAALVILFCIDAGNGAKILLGSILFLLAVTLANFWRLDFLITESGVTFGFGLIRKTFPRSDIVSCEPYDLRFSNYLGYGIRFGRDGTVAYNTRNGRGVKMTFRSAKRPYVVSVDYPGRVCELLSPAECA
jgi:hypothetical protein